MIFTRLAREDIWRFMYTFSHICRNLTELQFKSDFFMCRPAKYNVQHTRTLKKRFPCLIFCARIGNLLLIIRQGLKFGGVGTCVHAASAINNNCVLHNYDCLR